MIRLEGLCFSYGDAVALSDVSGDAPAGALTVLVGPNAAGKSTLLGCVVGVLSPSRGRVLVGGERPDRLPPRLLAQRLAYVSQRPSMAAAFTVRDVVRLGRYALAPEEERVDSALTDLELGSLAHRLFSSLSVGQQQRVMLARALAQLGPAGHLVLDEPLSAMDLRHVRHSLLLLRELSRAGQTVLVALHDIELASRVADQVWILDRGRLVAEGPAEEVMTQARLEEVFGIPFRRLVDGAEARLVPQVLP